jgi:hypothetical protein
MWAATSDDESRVIDKHRPQEDTMQMTHEIFVPAEVAYRLERAQRSFGRNRAGRRPHRVPRRPWLTLPHPRRRPVSLA